MRTPLTPPWLDICTAPTNQALSTEKEKKLNAVLRPLNARKTVPTVSMQIAKNMAVFFYLYFHNNRCNDHVILDLFMEIPHTIWINLPKNGNPEVFIAETIDSFYSL